MMALVEIMLWKRVRVREWAVRRMKEQMDDVEAKEPSGVRRRSRPSSIVTSLWILMVMLKMELMEWNEVKWRILRSLCSNSKFWIGFGAGMGMTFSRPLSSWVHCQNLIDPMRLVLRLIDRAQRELSNAGWIVSKGGCPREIDIEMSVVSLCIVIPTLTSSIKSPAGDKETTWSQISDDNPSSWCSFLRLDK